MGLIRIVRTLVTVLLHPGSFWKWFRDNRMSIDPLRDYAAPVIVLVQLIKLPLVGIPGQAMFMAISGFLLDLSILYLLSGVAARMADPEGGEALRVGMLTLFCFSLTPLWLVEPFLFAAPWGWFAVAAALPLSLFIMKVGLSALSDVDFPVPADAFGGKAAMLLSVAAVISFIVMNGFVRLFTSS